MPTLSCSFRTRVKNIRCNIRMQGLLPRVHGNKHRQLHNALSFEGTEYVVCFIFSYAKQFALLLPGRVPRYSRSNIQLLTSSKSKRGIWNEYCQTAGESDKHFMAHSTFCRLWRSLIPLIIIMRLMTDLCWQYQKNCAVIVCSSNCSEEEKSSTIKIAEEHLRIVQMERSYYTSSRSVRSHYVTDNSFAPHQPAS